MVVIYLITNNIVPRLDAAYQIESTLDVDQLNRQLTTLNEHLAATTDGANQTTFDSNAEVSDETATAGINDPSMQAGVTRWSVPLKDKANGLAVAVTMPVHAFQRLYSDHELLRSLADRNKNNTESSFTEDDLATAQIALALDVLVNTTELDTQVDIYNRVYRTFVRSMAVKQAALHLVFPAI